MSVEDHIRHTLAQYAQVHDGEDVAGVLALFTEDGRISVPSGAAPVGHEAMRAFLADGYTQRHAANKRARHLYNNLVIEVDGDQARVSTDFVAYQSIAGGPWQPTVVGRCLDRLVLLNGQWLFTDHQVLDARAAS